MRSADFARLRFLFLAGAALLAGCGGLASPYMDHGPKNLILAPRRTSSSFFASRTVRMDIYRGTKIDQAAYLGTVRLTGAGQHIGLPEGEPLLLHIGFREAGPLMSTVAVNAQRVLLTVRPGERYRLVTEYGDGGFDYRLERVRQPGG
jgi:hypothetical protein